MSIHTLPDANPVPFVPPAEAPAFRAPADVHDLLVTSPWANSGGASMQNVTEIRDTQKPADPLAETGTPIRSEVQNIVAERDVVALAELASGLIPARLKDQVEAHLTEGLRTGNVEDAASILPWLRVAAQSRLESLGMPKVDLKLAPDAKAGDYIDDQPPVRGYDDPAARDGVGVMNQITEPLPTIVLPPQTARTPRRDSQVVSHRAGVSRSIRSHRMGVVGAIKNLLRGKTNSLPS